MSSTGQIIGYVAGAVIGFFTGGAGWVAMGAAIGGVVGAAIDPPKGPHIEGPRLSDLSVQGVGYGNPIPRVYGTIATFGTIFWVENNALKETATTESQGKGGGGAETTSYTYSATFALALCQGPIEAVRRIWIAGKLVYDASSSDVGSIIASAEASNAFTVYLGTDDQLADPRMQAALGIANVPAYRGLAYIVFEDLQLADYGNTLMGAQIKVEVVSSADYTSTSDLIASAEDVSTTLSSSIGSIRIADGSLRFVSIIYDNYDYDLSAVQEQHHAIASSRFTYGDTVAIPEFHDTSIYFGKGFVKVVQSDVDVSMFVLTQNPTVHVIGYSKSGEKIMDSGPFHPDNLYWQIGAAVIDGGDLFVSYNSSTPTYKIHKLPFSVYGQMPDSNSGPTAPIVSTALGYDVDQMGVSENYLYAVSRTLSDYDTLAVLKFDRETLDYVETFTAAVRGEMAKIMVVGDDHFYTLGNLGVITEWHGSVAVDTGLRYTQHGDRFVESWVLHLSGDVFYVFRPTLSGAQTTPADLFLISRYMTDNVVILGDIVEAESISSRLLTSSDVDTSALDSSVRGYKVTQTAAIRAALDPLQASWPFDVVHSGYGINFIPRGTSSVASIGIEDLGAVSGSDKQAIRITNSREMDLQIPRRVELTHLDLDREYDIGQQASERINTDAINILRVELPIVLTSDEAAQKAESLLYLYWLERNDLAFTLPPIYSHLEHADVITINADSATYEVRLVSTELLPDGRIECTAKYNNAAIYSSSAVGEYGLVLGQVLTWPGMTSAELIDAPALLDSMGTPGFIAVLYGEADAWSGGTLMQTGDQGATWTVAAGFLNTSPAVGLLVSESGPIRFDFTNSREIVLRLETGALSSCTFLQLLGGVNHFAYGIDGRWEIIAAQTCTYIGSDQWRLTDIISGRFGTEWASVLHAANDRVVLLDTNSAKFVGQNINTIGSERIYRAVTNGMALDTASDIAMTYRGVNLECLSPVAVRGVRDASNDWAIDWVRRTRIGGEWRDLVDVPLSETTEAYIVEIYGEVGRTTLKRTIASSSNSVAYTSAQQTTDFGSVQSTLYVSVYQVSEYVGNGFPSSVTLTASTATASPPLVQYVNTDPYWANVVLAMHMDGSNGGTTFTDVKGHTITRYAATTSTTVYKYGTASAYFPGNVNYYLTTPAVSDFLLGSGDFTVDFWIKLNDTNSGKVVGIWSDTSGTGFSWKVAINSTAISLAYSTTGANFFAAEVTGLSIGTSAMRFIEVSRSGTTVYFFVDGTLVGTVTGVSATFYAVSSSKLLEIGRDSAGPGSYINAYIDDIRILKGYCRHTASYYSPTSAFPETA